MQTVLYRLVDFGCAWRGSDAVRRLAIDGGRGQGAERLC